MSGHSKWSQIKRQKGATDQKRGAVFTKLGNAITIAAREGGSDPTANFKLRLAIDQAKAANLPKDNIERAIKRGTGELVGDELQELIYEAVAPNGVAVIIKALTDNKNRTAAAVKHILSKHGASLGSPGSVSWQFQEQGLIRLASPSKGLKEELELAAIDLGAVDVAEEAEAVVVITQKTDLQKVKEGLEAKGFSVDHAELELIPENYIEVDSATQGKLDKLFEALDDEPDVADFYTNLK
jgi:YebC/PmpR family DNA-binding regulatory protein